MENSESPDGGNHENENSHKNVLIFARSTSSGNGESQSHIHHQHLVSANSFSEFNPATTSLSDDSGFPQTSISSGDSSRIYLNCKFDFELAESDGEVSQFDSLSEGGMSGENFNTLKKGPLAPIDPPPEFQDSPQTTLLRSKEFQEFAENLIKDILGEAFVTMEVGPGIELNCFNSIQRRSGLYSSDSRLNSIGQKQVVIENIYDDPSDSTRNSDDIEVDYYLSKQPPQSSIKRSCEKKRNSGQHLMRPNSRNSLQSRLSSSHNSLTITGSNKADDSIFITQAMSHDVLLGQEIIDFYNVPLDSDIYALPVDMVPGPQDVVISNDSSIKSKRLKFLPKKVEDGKKKLFRKARQSSQTLSGQSRKSQSNQTVNGKVVDVKRFSNPENLIEFNPVLATKSRKKISQKTLPKPATKTVDSSDEDQENHHDLVSRKVAKVLKRSKKSLESSKTSVRQSKTLQKSSSASSPTILPSVPPRKQLTTSTSFTSQPTQTQQPQTQSRRTHNQFSINFKQKFCSIFRFRNNKQAMMEDFENNNYELNGQPPGSGQSKDAAPNTATSNRKITLRALPPLPTRRSGSSSGGGGGVVYEADGQSAAQGSQKAPSSSIDSNNNDCDNNSNGSKVDASGDGEEERGSEDEEAVDQRVDFASNFETIKQFGWYWGPISSQAAEKILSNEPDGSFIVRDSSDDHYIFSLTFKLNNCVRHVRIEQDKGTFSFGSFAKFKSRTIVEFIEKAVEHSRSGRYLFFLHRRPEHGPMRVQLKNPVSRFKHIQSLQHMCRFVILKAVVRKDLIQTLPLPRRILDYLAYKNCYTEHVDEGSVSSNSGEN